MAKADSAVCCGESNFTASMSTHQRPLAFRDETHQRTGRTILQAMPGGGTATSAEMQKVIRSYQGDVQLTIDVDAILNDLGRRALISRGGKAQALNGLIG